MLQNIYLQLDTENRASNIIIHILSGSYFVRLKDKHKDFLIQRSAGLTKLHEILLLIDIHPFLRKFII